MRLLIISFIVLLASAICSCRSERHVVTRTGELTTVETNQVKTAVCSDEILTLINSSTEIDLSGITVEFYPPDSAHPDARAAPRSIKIESASSKSETGTSRIELASVIESDSINRTMEQVQTLNQTQNSKKGITPQVNLILTCSLIAVGILLIIIILKIIRNGTLF